MIPRAARGVPPPGAGDRAPCHISRARGGGGWPVRTDQRSEIRELLLPAAPCRSSEPPPRPVQPGRAPRRPCGARAQVDSCPAGRRRRAGSRKPAPLGHSGWEWSACHCLAVAGSPWHWHCHCGRHSSRERTLALSETCQAPQPAACSAGACTAGCSAGRGPASSPGTARRTCLGPRLCQSPSRAGFPPQFRCFPPTLPPRSPEAPFGLRSCGLWISDMSEAEMSEEENIPRGGGQASRALAATGTVPATVAGRGLMRFRAHLHHWQRQPHWLGWVS